LRHTTRYGFITPEDGSDVIFCHQTSIQDGNALAKGAFVEYAVVLDEAKGKNRAEEVTGGITSAPRSVGACYNCGEEGHLARDCPSEKIEQAPAPPADYTGVAAAAPGKVRGVCARWTARG
jgi:cold shock CspA family protein